MELICIALFLRNACLVGRCADESLEFNKHVRNFLETTFSNVDNLVSALRVLDGAADSSLLGAEILRCDQTCWIICTTIDAKTC